MEELVDAQQEEKNNRGGMLTALCVLSWIYIGLAFISIIFSLVEGKSTAAELEDRKYEMLSTIDESTPVSVQQMMVNMIDTMEKQNDYFWLFKGIDFFAVVIGFFAVFMMYKLRKTGYWLYLVYSIFPLLIHYFILGESKLYNMILLVLGLFSVLFIILYGVQLKRMR
ncbi:MAG: hypothetical protein WDZ35_02015 [Crocinitomicaceae bacterium]